MGQFHALKNVKMGCSLFQYNTGSGLIGVFFMDCMLVFEYRGKMTINNEEEVKRPLHNIATLFL